MTLPWPAADLRPNARVHHFALHKARAKARHDAEWATRAAIGVQWGASARPFHDGASDVILRQVAHPPDNRHRDRDNLDSSLKAARDGISAALGINDRFFRPTGIEWGPVKPGGEILIYVEVA